METTQTDSQHALEGLVCALLARAVLCSRDLGNAELAHDVRSYAAAQYYHLTGAALSAAAGLPLRSVSRSRAVVLYDALTKAHRLTHF